MTDRNIPGSAAARLLSGEAVPRWELEAELGSAALDGREVLETLLRAETLELELVVNPEGLELVRRRGA
ncbi:MAG: hypothetical protein U0869_21395 [Chloroflexota bacterium]